MSIKKGGIKIFKIILGFNTLDFSQQDQILSSANDFKEF